MITIKTICNDQWMDIVFEGRNKSYGAYELRRSSDRNMLLSVLGTLSFFVVVSVSPAIVNLVKGDSHAPVKKEKKEVIITLTQYVDHIKLPQPVLTIPAAPPAHSAPGFSKPEIKDADNSASQIPNPDAVIEQAAGPAGSTGTSSGPGEVVAAPLPIAGSASSPMIMLDVFPEFPGGEEARIKFIQEHIAYPQMGREAGIAGTVYVQFVVGPDGKLSNVHVLRSLGSLFDEEVMRVISLMPAWKPGKQNNTPVYVQCNMPFKFTLK